MKPEFSKPFSAEHARDGAPFCCADGTAAEIVKWDCRGGECPLLGVIDNDQFGQLSVRWTEAGVPHAEREIAKSLVMLPLGMLEGKPVFTGDAIEDGCLGDWTSGFAQPRNRVFTNCRWPAPAKVYPKTRMTGADLISATGAADWIDETVIASIANAALQHACDAEQVVPMTDVMEVARSLNKRGRTERDMAVARAVAVDIRNCWAFEGHKPCKDYIDSIDLATIISNLK